MIHATPPISRRKRGPSHFSRGAAAMTLCANRSDLDFSQIPQFSGATGARPSPFAS